MYLIVASSDFLINTIYKTNSPYYWEKRGVIMISNIKEGITITLILTSSNAITLTVIKVNPINGFIKGIDSNGSLVIINSKKIESIQLSPRATYTRIQIPVLPTPGQPPFVYFDVDIRFTEPQIQKIGQVISRTLAGWRQHLEEKWNGGANNGVSQLATCTNMYATQNLQPVWYQGPPIQNGIEAVNLAMDAWTQRIIENGFHQVPVAKIHYRIPPAGEVSTIRSNTALRQFHVPLTTTINPQQLDDLGIGTLTGSLFHAWLHRVGFHHPKLTSYFIAEAPMCVMRGFQDKTPGVPDSSFIRFFD